MCHTSASTYLTWSLLSVLLGAFLFFHLWKFDRFQCLKWNNGPYSGAFKRIMTYTYLLSVPLIMSYSVGFAVIKYKMGFKDIAGVGIVPTPYEYWPEVYRRAIFPLNMLFTFELCFWLFLVNAGSVQQDWFRSLYFKAWIFGAIFAMLYMPLVTGLTHSDPLKARNEAYTFLAGSLGGLCLTIWFLPILWTFPKFLDNLRGEGVDINTIVRLTTFHELNCLRVVFRFLFVFPFLILGVDGVTEHKYINASLFWTESLTFIAAVGCVVSSGITLVIFFPRNVQSEIQARNASRDKQMQMRTFHTTQQSDAPYMRPQSPLKGDTEASGTFENDSPTMRTAKMRALDEESADALVRSLSFAPNRRLETGGMVEGAVIGLTERNLARHNYSSNVHPFVHNFTSPIDLGYGDHNYLGMPGAARR
ncbi:hypothetical protein B0H21DRAFT_781378 [Amylocystis lapponica]|nr:hypothetical protein B0H21DRAFT_781378 [Amylocystis lapponica]